MNRPIAAILARVSRPTQSMESQVSDLKRVAAEMNYDVPERFIFEEQISGVHRGRKESLERILAAIDDKKNKIEAVFIWEITRLNRDAMDFATELHEFIQRGVPVYFYDVELWSLDPNTKQRLDDNINKLIGASIYGLQEWNKIAKRTKRGRDAVAAKGLYVGHLADGYIAVKDGEHKRIDRDIDREQVIKDIFNYFVDGKSTDEIAAILNAMNVPTTAHYRVKSRHFNYKQYYRKRKGEVEYDRTLTKWSGSTVSQILSNEWYIGKRYYHIKDQEKLKEEDWEVYEVPRIIDPEIWEKARMLREERSITFRTKRISKKHNYILGGLVFCGKCGFKMYGHYTGKNNHYFCSSVEHGINCDTRGINKENFEAIVCQIVKYRALIKLAYGTPDVATDFFRMSEEEKRKIKREIKTLELLVGDINKRLNEIESELFNLSDELSTNDEKRKKYIYGAMEKREKEETQLQIEKEEKEADLILYRRKLNSSDNIDHLFEQIKQTNDIKDLQRLVEATVSRINVYTIDPSINYVVITYINNKTDSFIYSFRLLKHHYIHLSKILKPATLFEFDPNNKVLLIKDDVHLAFEWYDGLDPKLRKGDIPELDDALIPLEDNEYNSLMDDERIRMRLDINKYPDGVLPSYGLGHKMTGIYPLDNETEIYLASRHGIKTYVHEIDFRSIIVALRSTGFCEYFDPTPFIEPDERREIQALKEKEYQKKRNNGLPTSLPTVVRDANYEELCKERKRLYNRKDKIKNKKSLSPEEKERQLEEVQRLLDLLKLRIKVKRLTREQSVEIYRNTQKESGQ